MADESSQQLPANLKPVLEKEPLAVELAPHDVATEIPAGELPEIAREFQLIGINREAIKNLAVLGISLESTGSVQVANGANLITMKCALSVIQQLEKGAGQSFENALKAASPMGSLVRAMTALGNSMKTKLPTSVKSAPGPTRKNSFPADGPILIDKAIVNLQH